MKRIFRVVVALGLLLVLAWFVLTRGSPLDGPLPDHEVNLSNGELFYWAGGCASCHAASNTDSSSDDENLLTLGGGREFSTPFGVFRAPNISPDPEFGIGSWSTLDFVNAMLKGLSPDNRHYYPVFPYPHYQNMKVADVLDLKAFMDTLPASSNVVAGHSLQFPYSVRRGVGLWKKRYLPGTRLDVVDAPTPELARGKYLVHGAAHCGACHTPRDGAGGEITSLFLAGAESFELDAGRIPNITPHKNGIGAWSKSDIEYSLKTGFDPDFDSFGSSMVAVQENMARLPAEDRAAIAAYLKSIPAIDSETD
ncbi:MAG TPA: cytochrome c [Xanthomonadales bacterium]|nr:cytochrome c [Xanthomonadales bacterium]